MSRQKHVHKYHKITAKFRTLWACALPTCSHYMPPDLEETLIGKMSICWKCGEKFLLTEDNMQKAQPFCSDCNPSVSSMADLLDKFGVK